MALTFIDTNSLPRAPSSGQGEVTEVLNEALCGAKNVRGTLRWLKPGESFSAETCDKHQLIYLMEGEGRIHLGESKYDVSKGAGVYLGPSETATIEPARGASVKLFHIVVPKMPK